MTSTVKYLGDLRCESTHLQSGTKIYTDPPTDNHGKGEMFSPTDLCATSLAQCMLTTVAILGADRNLSIAGSYAEVQKVMNPKPRKIAEVILTLFFKGHYTEEEKEFIRDAALHCPVALSLHPELKQTVSFIFG